MDTEILKCDKDQLDTLAILDFGHASWDAKPDHVSLVGQCLMQWTKVEMHLATLLAAILRADTHSAIALFSTLRRNTNRFEGLTKAAEYLLDDEGITLVRALNAHAAIVQSARDKLAHGLWGVSPIIEDGLLWISQEKMTLSHVDILKTSYTLGKSEYWKAFASIREHTFVYRRSDLANIFNEITVLIHIVNDYRGCIAFARGNSPLSLDAKGLQRLKSFVPIQERLEAIRLRDEKQKSQTSLIAQPQPGP